MLIMKILQITSEAPGKKSGGQIGVAQTIKSICVGNDVDYVGPEIEDSEFRNLYKKKYILQRNNKICYKILDLFKGVTTTYYRSWMESKSLIHFNKYDIVIMDFAKFDFCLPEIKGKKLITRIHNIESEYAKKDYQMNKNIKNYFVSLFAKKAENKIIQNSFCLVFLHKEDAVNMEKRYHFDCMYKTIPVCVDAPVNRWKHCFDNNTLHMLITGSLWFGGNYKGVKWVIEKVLPRLDVDYELIIAGKRPNPDLVDVCHNNRKIKLVDSPEYMNTYFERADVVLAPVFDGAGMKVKVAEALSYGKPVIGTEHAFIGYEIEDGVNSYVANDEIKFSQLILSYASLGVKEKEKIAEEVYKLYERKYSIKYSQSQWKEILS